MSISSSYDPTTFPSVDAHAPYNPNASDGRTAPSTGGGGTAAPVTPPTTGLDPNSDLILGADGNIYGIRRTYEPKSAEPNGGSQYVYQTYLLGAATDLATVSTASGIPVTVLQSVLPQLQAKAKQNTNGTLLGKNGNDSYAVRMPDGSITAQSLAQVSVLPGIQPYDIAKADTDYLQQQKQINQLGNAQLRNKNPDGTYSVTMPDGSIANKSLAEVSGLPGISAGDVAQADKDFVYSQMRANEANWELRGVQMYNGGNGPGANNGTMNPNWTPPPNLTPPPQGGATGPAPAPYPGGPQPQPVQPVAPPEGGVPGAAPTPTLAPYYPQAGPTGDSTPTGALPAPVPTPAPYYPQAGPTGDTAPAPAPATAQGSSGGNTSNYTQGAAMSNGMTPSPSTADRSGAASGVTTPAPAPAPGQYPLAAQASSGVGNYGNPNGTNQQYELDTRGIQDQYDRGNYTYQMGQPTYANGDTRQQFSQRITDLQNQYNMSQSQFNLNNQGQAQANQAQEYAQKANQNQMMGQSRTIAGMGLGSLAPAQVTGLR